MSDQRTAGVPVKAEPRTSRALAPVAVERVAVLAGGAVMVSGIVISALPTAVFVLGALVLATGIFLTVYRRLQTSPTGLATEQREVELERRARSRARFAEAKKDLYAVKPGTEKHPLATRVLAAIDTALDAEQTFTRLLARKFEAGELTAERYAEAAGQTLEALTANIIEAASRIGAAKADDSDLATLLAANDRALASLAAVNSALAALRTTREGTTVDLDQALAELAEMTRRSALYDGR